MGCACAESGVHCWEGPGQVRGRQAPVLLGDWFALVWRCCALKQTPQRSLAGCQTDERQTVLLGTPVLLGAWCPDELRIGAGAWALLLQNQLPAL